MKPTAAEIENGMSRTIKANIPPVNASGTPVNIINESFNEPNASNSKPIIKTNVTGTTMLNLCEADCSF